MADLHIDLNALLRNWRLLNHRHTHQSCAAVVKANAYGLGMETVSAALADAGCNHFFVATLQEAVELRQTLTSQFIYVFNGVGKGEEVTFFDYNLAPVINSMPQFERWETASMGMKAAFCALHVDTGMNRLGLSIDEAEKLAAQPERVASAHIRMVMSHLASGSDPQAEQNTQQLKKFNHVKRCFPTIAASFANSAGVFLDAAYHFDMGRPGCAIYGINPFDEAINNPVEHVATLTSAILQLRTTTEPEEPVGYSGSVRVEKGCKIATLGIGYADGLPRILSGRQIYGYIGEHKAPLLGRISMDTIMLDVSKVPEALLHEGVEVELINHHQTVNHIAEAAETIGYEIYTRLGRRIRRHYNDVVKVN